MALALPQGPARAQIIPPTVEPIDPRDRVRPRERPETLPPLNVPAFRGIVPPGSDVVRLPLKGVRFEGATVLDQAALEAPFADLLGRDVSLAAVYAAAQALQDRYRDAGYVLTRVVVPAQRIEEGIIRLRVVEGFIDEVLIQGDIGLARRQVERIAENLKAVRPVRNRDLERYLLLINDIPGIAAVGTLRAGTGAAGAAQLIIEVRRKVFDAFVTFNNRESAFTGPWAAAVGAAGNALTPFGDRLEGLAFFTLDSQEETAFTAGSPFEQTFFFAAYESMLNGEGTRARAEVSFGVSSPGSDLAVLDIVARVNRYAGEVSHPFVRSRRVNVTGTVSFQSILERTTFADFLVSRDRLSVLGLDLDIDFRDTVFRAARTELELGFRQGMDILDATQAGDFPVSRPEGSATYSAFLGYVSRTEMLTDRIDLFAEAVGQYASTTLLSQAEFRVGGDRFGRAFDPSQLAGDLGFGAGVELRYTGRTGWRVVPEYQTYAFSDMGQVRNTDTTFPPRASIWSAGAGVRTSLKPAPYTDLFLDFEYAHGESFGDGPALDTRNEYYVRLTAQF